MQGSFDLINWFDIDSVSNNTSTVTSREFIPVQARYVRVIVMKGLQVNPHLASIMDLAVYETDLPVSTDLTNLSLSDGELSPSFTKDTTNYTADVDYDTDSIRVIPRAEDARATIKVNKTVVKNGQQSEAINLTAEVKTTINVEVIAKDVGSIKTYTVEVKRASSAYLSDIKYSGGRRASMNPRFSSDTFDYTATTRSASVKIIPTAEDNNAKINVDEQEVQSVKECIIKVDSKPKIVIIKVSSAVGSETKTYRIVIS